MAKKVLLILSSILLSIGLSGGPLLTRLYFIKDLWLSSWLQTIGFPTTLIPLSITYIQRKRANSKAGESYKTKRILMEKQLFFAAACIGILTGLVDYLFSYGSSSLPVSTAAVINSTRLCFTVVLTFLLVEQKFTIYSVNAVVLLTVAGAVLTLNTSGDRPSGETNKQYVMGFVAELAASALNGSLPPLIELTYRKGKQAISFSPVMEIQFVMSFFATLFCTVGMAINEDLKEIPEEARDFGLGEESYSIVLVLAVMLWQMFYFGSVGVIFCASGFFLGILRAVLLPVTEVVAVIFLKENSQVEKGVALALSLTGFVSYFYGELKENSSNKNHNPEAAEGSQAIDPLLNT